MSFTTFYSSAWRYDIEFIFYLKEGGVIFFSIFAQFIWVRSGVANASGNFFFRFTQRQNFCLSKFTIRTLHMFSIISEDLWTLWVRLKMALKARISYLTNKKYLESKSGNISQYEWKYWHHRSCSTFWELSSSFCLNFEVLIFRWFWCLKSAPFWFFLFFAPWKMILWFFVLRLFDFVQWFDFNTFKTWSLILIFTTVDFFGGCKRFLSMIFPTKTKSLF